MPLLYRVYMQYGYADLWVYWDEAHHFLILHCLLFVPIGRFIYCPFNLMVQLYLGRSSYCVPSGLEWPSG